MKTPNNRNEKPPIVYTTKAKCRDCYRCVRVCPVNAIRMHDNQAQVLTNRCIACGTCIAQCPQQAKTYRADYGKVLQMIEENMQIAISVAPSFVAYYSEPDCKRLPSALRMLGFHYVGETAIGAWHSALGSANYMRSNEQNIHICTACPAVVNYISQQKPEFVDKLVPIVSPMMAHAKMLKKRNPQIKVVFVGPCVAKKDEGQWPKNEQFIDAVLTFEELDELFKIKNIQFDFCEESAFDEHVAGEARLFPLEGGLLRTAGLSTDLFDKETIAISGLNKIVEMIDALQSDRSTVRIIEPLYCESGCINGPFARNKANSLIGRNEVLNYAQSQKTVQQADKQIYSALNTSFSGLNKGTKKTFSEEQISEVLRQTGKLQPSDQLNCSACGYQSCREKAIAVLEGLAEPQMCMPYMRRFAEQKFDTMIAYDPNGIILLNKELEIIHMNPAFKKMFSCSDALLGKKVSYIIDPDIFEKLTTGKETVLRQHAHYASYNLICHLVAYAMPEVQHYVGVFVDITDSQSSKDKLTELKSETIHKAQELIEHQIGMAQELAKFLGENTARGEILMKKLIDSIGK